MIEDFYPNLENAEISDVIYDELLLPADSFRVETACFSSHDENS